jgi:hypothetical protein
MTILQWELLFYLFMASVGMYKLVRGFGGSTSSSLVLAIAYVTCGFFTDSGPIIPWITSAAWIPFVIHYFRKVLLICKTGTVLKLAASLSLLLLAGYPSYFIFISYILLFATIIWAIKTPDKKLVLKNFSGLAISALLVFAICSPAIFSWIDFFDYYARGKEAGLDRSLQNHFPILSSVSFLTGPAVSVDTSMIDTDRSARNVYVGVFTLVFFFTTLFSGRKSREQWFILSIILFAFLFSLGPATPVRGWCYSILPGMDTFRHPSSMRLFCIIGIIILAVPGFEKFLQQPLSSLLIKRAFLIAGIAIVLLIIILLFNGGFNGNQFSGDVKTLVESITFQQALVILAVVQLFFVLLYYIAAMKVWKRLFLFLAIFNSLIFCWIAQPLTLLSSVSTKEVDSQVAQFPTIFQPPPLGKPIFSKHASFEFLEPPYLHVNFYWKQVSIQNDVRTPTISKAYKSFLNDTALRSKMDQYPFIFFSNTNGNTDSLSKNEIFLTTMDSSLHNTGSIAITKFLPAEFELKVNSQKSANLNVVQHFHHRWKAYVDGKIVPIRKANHAFMMIEIPEGSSDIHFVFEPGSLVKWAIIVSGIVLLSYLVYSLWFIVYGYRQTINHKQ